MLNLLQEIEININLVRNPPWSSENNRLWSQLAVLVMEHGWQRLARHMGDISIPVCSQSESLSTSSSTITQNITSVDLARKLLHVSRAVVLQKLASEEPQNEQCKSPDPAMLELGRGLLQLYFAAEIAKTGSRLEQLYLDGDRKDEHREAAPELKRTFILNLSRFMLGVVARLEEDFGIRATATRTTPPVITESEELDSRLYLIDRFVHVELEVDERFNIRQHLARQVDSDAHHYLTHNYYRDHLRHAIDVFLLGHLLLNTHVYWLQERIRPLAEHMEEIKRLQKPENRAPMTKKQWMQNWAVASLLHDIGYQIGHGRNISVGIETWEKYFSLSSEAGFSWLGLGAQAQRNENAEETNMIFHLIEDRVISLCQEYNLTDCIPIDDEDKIRNLFDHGVLSALRIAQVVCYADGNLPTGELSSPSHIAHLYRPAIHAVAYHNLFQERVSFVSHPLTCLLRLCDELQEWDRRRVNMEKIVKQLYLDIQEGHPGGFPSYEVFDSIKANLKITPIPKDGLPVSMKLSLHEKTKPWFNFDLLYHDPVVASFEPTMTLLCKAYNLQHLDLHIPQEDERTLRFSIKVMIPTPVEYGNLTEYDIYSRFTENERFLPLFRQFKSVEEAEAGLIRLIPEVPGIITRDYFAIILQGTVGPTNHHGWLPQNPHRFFDDFINFKESMIIGRILGRGKSKS